MYETPSSLTALPPTAIVGDVAAADTYLCQPVGLGPDLTYYHH